MLIREGLSFRSHDKARPGSTFSKSKLNSNITCRVGIFTFNGDQDSRRCLRDIQMQIDVTNKALLIKGDANGFVRPHHDHDMVMDSLH